MTNELVKSIISDGAYIIITGLFGIISFQFKKFIAEHNDYIQKEKELVKTQIGAEQYYKNKDKAIDLILRIEEEAKAYNWDSEVKHSNAVKLISEKTGLSSEDIYDIIKSTVTKIKTGQVVK
ncbi:hypothetical protein HBE96_23305 [Clostridium sp. P21]|uniref:Phage protein n=1 Tax=Clostridium muellerianum TaxID=2716538 RepID=A0A7Y0EL56_9CLOT|nr:hypothetical protein [Clostridium muellerianum]NMM65509.1 hypothetical protein [Clostridium muellerianum]